MEINMTRSTKMFIPSTIFCFINVLSWGLNDITFWGTFVLGLGFFAVACGLWIYDRE